MNRASVGTIRRLNYLSIILTQVCNQQQNAFSSERVGFAVCSEAKIQFSTDINKTDRTNLKYT